MIKKFKNFCEKPITWGSYFKLCGVSLVGFLICLGVTFGKITYDNYQDEKRSQEILKRMNEDQS